MSNQAKKRYVTEELSAGDPPLSLGFQGLGRLLIDRANSGQQLCASIDEREHVARLACLGVAVTSQAT